MDTREEEDSATGHELTCTAAVAPTCEAAGTVEYWSCSRCKKNFADEDATKELTDITDPATGHTPGAEATCTTAQTCTVCGAEIAPARNHDWREAWTAGDTTHYHTCSRCEERGEEAEHTYTEKVDDTYLVSAATCKQKAVYYKSCSVCGAKGTETFKSGELAAHTEVTDEAVEATCSHAGLTEGKHCSVCDAVLVEQEVVPMLEHDWGEGKVTKEPTCTETGVMTYTCSHCSETKTEPITAKGHTEVTDPAVAPTCTTAGKTQGSHCSVCGSVLVEQQEIAKLAHTYVGHVCSRCYAI